MLIITQRWIEAVLFHAFVMCCTSSVRLSGGGTVAAAPPPFRPSDPALRGNRRLVTQY